MEVARLEALYTANTSDFDRKSAQTDARFRQTAKEAANTEKAVSHAFKNPPSGLSQSITGVHRQVGNLSGSMMSLKDVAAGVFAGFTIASVVSELTEAASAVLAFKSNLQSSEIAFTTMLGSADLAQRHLKELQQFALTTPFEFEGLVDASKRMQAMGFEAKQVIPILTDVGNAVASVGGNRQVLDRVILALSQIQAKGKVSAQEMNQLAEAGIPAWRLLAEEIGKSRAETIKLAEDGKISGEVFLEAFRKFSQANFGGMMERQSRTFGGAMSNIKDTLLQTAGTAFDPLFQQISQITDRMAQEMQSGKPALETALQSVVTGLIEIIGTAGAQAGAAFVESTARKIGDVSAWKQLLSNVSGATLLDPLLRGLFSIDPEDLFGLGDPTGPITKAISIPDVRAPLNNLKTSQQQVSEEARKAQGIMEDLSLKVMFYGQNTETAATKQRLLAIGMEALVSAEGRRAVQLAQLIDRQRIANQLADSQKRLTDDLTAITEGKYKNALESLSASLQSAIVETSNLLAAERGGLTPLEQFNLTLGAQVEGMLKTAQTAGFTSEQILNLAAALLNARTAMNALTGAQEQNRRSAEIKHLGQQRRDLLRSLAGIDVDLNRQMLRAPSDEIQRLAEQLEGLSFLKISPGGLDRFVERLRSGSLDAQTAMAEINTAVVAAAGDIGEELPKVTTKIVNLFLKSKELTDFFAREEGTQRYRDTLASLHDVIQGDVTLTNAQRIEKLLLADAYKNLTESQIESLRATAQEADIADRLRERERERIQSMKEVAEDLGSIFSDAFDSIGNDWRDMWQDLSRTARSISRQIMQELITGLFSKLFNVPFTSQSGGLVALFTNSIFNRNTSPGGAGAALAGFGGGRAFGGPVEAGMLYRVNERGAEYFRPNIGGTVIPLGQQPEKPSISRLFLVDDERQAFERGAVRREIARSGKQMRKVGKLVPGF